MAGETRDLIEDFETWLLRRVAQAIEADEVPAELLIELQTEFDAARLTPQDVGHAAAIRQIAALGGVPEEEAAGTLAVVEAQPMVTREFLMRRFAESWLEGERLA